MRNVATLLQASLRPRAAPGESLACRVRVMPWDVGISILKSDRYFAIAEAAQGDYLARTRLFVPMARAGVRWVNLAQACRFQAPLRLFDRFEVHTRVACMDDKHAYVAHDFRGAAGAHARVLVKVKFKQGRLTVPPARWLGEQPRERTPEIEALDALG